MRVTPSVTEKRGLATNVFSLGKLDNRAVLKPTRHQSNTILPVAKQIDQWIQSVGWFEKRGLATNVLSLGKLDNRAVLKPTRHQSNTILPVTKPIDQWMQSVGWFTGGEVNRSMDSLGHRASRIRYTKRGS